MVLGLALNFGRNLRGLRRRKGLKATEVSARAKERGYTLGTSTVYDLEANKRKPTEDTINALATVYEMTYEEVVLWALLGEFADGLRSEMLTPDMNQIIRAASSPRPERARRMREWNEELSTMRDDELDYSLGKMRADRAKLTDQRPHRVPAPVPATAKDVDA